jgi:hypothetical protein
MKTTAFASILALASALAIGSAAAQPVPFNEAGVTMGHWHIISKDVEENKKIFLAMGGKLFMPGGAPLMLFPGVYINLTLGNETGARVSARLRSEGMAKGKFKRSTASL